MPNGTYGSVRGRKLKQEKNDFNFLLLDSYKLLFNDEKVSGNIFFINCHAKRQSENNDTFSYTKETATKRTFNLNIAYFIHII